LLTEILFVEFALLLLFLAGYLLVAPFNCDHPFAPLCAPMCGLLIAPLAVTFLVSAGVSVRLATIVGVSALCTVGLISIFIWPLTLRNVVFNIGAIAVTGALVTMMATAPTARLGSPALLFMEGSDHAGYAHVADWILSHGFDQPVLSPERPYESWPHYMMNYDPRLSSYMILAMIASARNLPSLFAYDTALAIALAAGLLASAGAFAKSKTTSIFILSSIMLAGSWFSLGNQGYFGKVLAYPAILLIAGLFLGSERTFLTMGSLALMTASAAVCHSGVALALQLFCLLGIGCVALWFMNGNTANLLRSDLLAAAILVGIAVLATGFFAYPRPAPTATVTAPFQVLLTASLGIDLQHAGLQFISDKWQKLCLAVVLISQMALVLIAWSWRSPTGLALLTAPLLIIAGFYSAKFPWGILEVEGIPFACSICAAAVLLDRAPKMLRPLVVMLALAIVSARMPRALAVYDRYLINAPTRFQYSLGEFDDISAVIGKGIVQLDISDVNPLLPAFLELERRSVTLQFSPKTWQRLLAYRHWPTPTYHEPPQFILTSIYSPETAPPASTLITQTNHYVVLKP
jgi:hypothetical protein